MGLAAFISFLISGGGIFGISFFSHSWILCFLLVLLTDIKAGLVEMARLCHSCLALIPSGRADPRKSLPRALPHPLPCLFLSHHVLTQLRMGWKWCHGHAQLHPSLSSLRWGSPGCAGISGMLWHLFADRGVGNLSMRFCSAWRGEALG